MMNRGLLGYSKHEVLMRNYALPLALVLMLSGLGTACKGHRGNSADNGPAVQTQTIAPAVAQPAPTGTASKGPAKSKPAPVKKH